MKVKNFFKRFFAGIGIGTGAAIPGVSGAAIAVIFKVYEDIISAVNNFRKKFGYSIKVLLPILLGVVCAVIPCIYLFSLALESFVFGLICIFVGFLIGSLPEITNEVKGVQMTVKHKITLIFGIIFVLILGILSVFLGPVINLSGLFEEMPWWLYLVLIPVGCIAAVALTVPGLSGSLILLIIGFYRPLVDSAVNWSKSCLNGDFSCIGRLLGMIGCFAIGCLIGVVLVSKIMNILLTKNRVMTFFGIIGFVIGSIAVLFFNYDVFKYYLVWAGKSSWLGNPITNIHPALPIYIEIPIGIVLLIITMLGSYLLTKKANNKED